MIGAHVLGWLLLSCLPLAESIRPACDPDIGREAYVQCLTEQCEDSDMSFLAMNECGQLVSSMAEFYGGGSGGSGCDMDVHALDPRFSPGTPLSILCPCACNVGTCQETCRRKDEEKIWLHPLEHVGPDGDRTQDEIAIIAENDPGMMSSSYRHGQYGGDVNVRSWTERLEKDGQETLDTGRYKVLDGPEQWASEMGVTSYNATPISVYGQQTIRTNLGLAPKVQVKLTGSYWQLTDRPRRFGLLVEDLQRSYGSFVSYVLPAVVPLIKEFRAQGLPVFWTNYIRRPDDKLYGGLDRFYGPQGIKDHTNPGFIFGKDGALSVPEVMPTSEEVRLGRQIKSAHLDKFLDVNENGKSIFGEMLAELGVDTLVVTGAWTDDCILGTVYHAVDGANLDAIVIEDGVASALTTHFKALEIMAANVAMPLQSSDMLAYLQGNRGNGSLILPPRSPAAAAAGAEMAASPVASGELTSGSGSPSPPPSPVPPFARAAVGIDGLILAVSALTALTAMASSALTAWFLRRRARSSNVRLLDIV